MAKQTITLDPVTRIEGHLRINAEVDEGKVTSAWSSAQMWRGLEIILKGKAPQDAWVFAQKLRRMLGFSPSVFAASAQRFMPSHR